MPDSFIQPAHRAAPAAPLTEALLQRRTFEITWPFLFAIVLLVGVSYLGMELLTATRAYVTGESIWSKGQKEAVSALLRYVSTADENDYQSFVQALQIPLSDRLARLEMNRPQPDPAKVRAHLLAGGISAIDTDAVAMLYERFRFIPFMQRVVAIWERADEEILALADAGEQLHAEVRDHPHARAAPPATLQTIYALDATLTPLEHRFSGTMGEAARAVELLLLLLTLALALLMLPVGFVLARRMVRKTYTFERELLSEKERLHVTLESICDAVVTLDVNGAIQYLNPAAELLTGHRLEQARGQRLDRICALYAEPNQSWPEGDFRRLLRARARQRFSVDASLRRADGAETPVTVVSAPLYDRQHRIEGMVLALRDVSQQRRHAQDLAFQASHDALTGLINRREFDQRLAHCLERMAQDAVPAALMYLDLDQFKVVNDTCGHAAGDELIRQLATLLQSTLRSSDTLARLGGDEFGVLLEQHAAAEVVAIAERLRQQVVDFRFAWRGQPFTVGVSIGVVHLLDTDLVADHAMSLADATCYLAKERGRNCVQVYRPDDATLASRRSQMEWTARIRSALEAGRFCLFAQCAIPLGPAGQQPDYIELLLRMRDEQGALVPPMAFIPAAERFGQMVEIDRWVIREALSQLAALSRVPACRAIWAINISGASICHPQFLDYVLGQFRATGVACGRVCFELTETAAIANLVDAQHFIRELRARGCLFALDDFGSGMSSFTYLRQLDVDFLKIDGSFVRDMLEDTTDRGMVEAIHRMGKVMGKRTVAESVGSVALVDAVRALGIDYAQGFGVALPEPFDVVAAKLARELPPAAEAPDTIPDCRLTTA